MVHQAVVEWTWGRRTAPPRKPEQPPADEQPPPEQGIVVRSADAVRSRSRQKLAEPRPVGSTRRHVGAARRSEVPARQPRLVRSAGNGSIWRHQGRFDWRPLHKWRGNAGGDERSREEEEEYGYEDESEPNYNLAPGELGPGPRGIGPGPRALGPAGPSGGVIPMGPGRSGVVPAANQRGRRWKSDAPAPSRSSSPMKTRASSASDRPAGVVADSCASVTCDDGGRPNHLRCVHPQPLYAAPPRRHSLLIEGRRVSQQDVALGDPYPLSTSHGRSRRMTAATNHLTGKSGYTHELLKELTHTQLAEKRTYCQGTAGSPCGRTADLLAGGQENSVWAVR